MKKLEPVEVSVMDEGSSDKKNEGKKFEDYEVSSAADTIMKAHEHMADPELMKHVHKHVDKKAKAIKSIADLKKRRSMMSSSSSGGLDGKA